jgi:hypothetical protein
LDLACEKILNSTKNIDSRLLHPEKRRFPRQSMGPFSSLAFFAIFAITFLGTGKHGLLSIPEGRHVVGNGRQCTFQDKNS